MNKEELIGKLQMVYVGDKNALNELICYYAMLKEAVELLKKENQKYKEVIDKAIDFINNNGDKQYNHHDNYRGKWYSPDDLDTLEDILKEVE